MSSGRLARGRVPIPDPVVLNGHKPRVVVNNEQEANPPLPYIDMSEWDSTPAPEREWAVDNRIPMYQPHLTTGPAQSASRCWS